MKKKSITQRKTNFHRKSTHVPERSKNEKATNDGTRDDIKTTPFVVGKMYSLNRWGITSLPLVRNTKNVPDFT